jgi:hypothetical protein
LVVIDASLAVVDDLDLVGVTVVPAEADAPLVVDADAVLAVAITLERFEPVAGLFAGPGSDRSARRRGFAAAFVSDRGHSC